MAYRRRKNYSRSRRKSSSARRINKYMASRGGIRF